MKKNVASLLLGLVVTVTFFSCNKDDEEISVEAGIIGSWQVESVDVMIEGQSLEDYMEQAMAELAAQFGQEYADQMAEAFSDIDMTSEFSASTFEFKEDKTAISTDVDGSKNGTWSVSDKDLTVTFDDLPQTFEVRSITSSQASLYQTFEDDSFGTPLTTEVTIRLVKE